MRYKKKGKVVHLKCAIFVQLIKDYVPPSSASVQLFQSTWSKNSSYPAKAPCASASKNYFFIPSLSVQHLLIKIHISAITIQFFHGILLVPHLIIVILRITLSMIRQDNNVSILQHYSRGLSISDCSSKDEHSKTIEDLLLNQSRQRRLKMTILLILLRNSGKK